MVLKPDQERVKTLLKDTITLLCRNGLSFNGKFCIDAVIGVTVDDNELFYMSMNEVIKSEKALLAEAEASSSDDEKRSGLNRKRLGNSCGTEENRKKRRHKHKPPRIKREGGGLNDSSNDDDDNYSDNNHGHDDGSMPQPDGGLDDEQQEQQASVFAVKRESGDRDNEEDLDSNEDIVFIKEEMDDAWSQQQSVNTSQDPSSSNFFSQSHDQMFQSAGGDLSNSGPHDQTFGQSLSDMNLVPVGSQDSGMMPWGATPSPSTSGGFRGRGGGRGRLSSTITSSTSPGGDLQLPQGLDQQIENLQALAPGLNARHVRRLVVMSSSSKETGSRSLLNKLLGHVFTEQELCTDGGVCGLDQTKLCALEDLITSTAQYFGLAVLPPNVARRVVQNKVSTRRHQMRLKHTYTLRHCHN